MNKHRQRSQSRLHDLFPGFASFLSSHIKKTCRAVLDDPLKPTDEPLRVLDLGCGTVPYAIVFEEIAQELKDSGSGRGVEIVLVDKDRTNLDEREIQGCASEWKWVDVLDFAEELRACKRSTEITGPFDVIILAASLHEFYFDSVSKMCKSWIPATFHQEFLHHLCLGGGLVAPRHGRVIIADYAWEEEAPPEHLELIAEHQFKIAQHADPPWSFASIFHIIGCMNAIGYRIQSSDRRGLYDQLNDKQINEMFAGLPSDVRETLRLRLGFILTFKKESATKQFEHPFTIQPTILHLSYAVERMFKESLNLDERVIREQLNNIFTTPEAKDGGLSPLVRLAQQIYQDSQHALKVHRATSPGACEIWFGIGLRKFKNSRFIPSLRRWWTPDVPPAAGGVFLRHAHDTGGERQRGLAGPVTIAFDTLLNSSSPSLTSAGIRNTPSIHNWCVRLHKAIRENVRERPASPESPMFRSLTILSPEARPHDHAISAAWGNDEQQRASGHYILRLCPETLDPSSPTSLSERVRQQLDRISEGVAQSVVSWLPADINEAVEDKDIIQWLYSAFLTVIFGLGDKSQIEHTIGELGRLRKLPHETNADRLNSVLEGTIERLRSYSEVDANREDFPQYRSYTTLAFGCDGLSTAAPDTLMIFSERPLPPSALNRVSRYTSDVFRRMVQAESEIIVERQAQTQSDLDATRRLIRAFGHDGKTPAALIQGVLTDDDFTAESRIAISKALSSRLIERLGGYRWLITEEKDLRQIRTTLWGQVGEFDAKWKSIDSIWIDAISMAILAVCVREDDQWPKLRQRLNIADLERRKAIVNSLDSPQEMINSVGNFRQVTNTFGLKTPFSLRRKEGGETTTGSPIVYHALRLIFSEIITNAFRHELPFADKSEPITMALDASTDEPEQGVQPQKGGEPVLANLTITITPSIKHPHDFISRNYNGLLSMKDACTAMGSTIVSRAVPVETQSDGEYVPLELPYFERHNGGIKWALKGIPLFR